MPSRSVAPGLPWDTLSRVAAPVAAVLGTLGLLAVAAPAQDVLRYLLAFGWCCVLPGVAVHRALRGRPDTLIEDVTWGTATGLIVALTGWAACTAAGVPAAQLAWPVVAVAAACATPTGRRRALDRSPYPARLSGVASVGAAAVGVLALALAQQQAWVSSQLPPGASAWYQDLYWYLGQVAELRRTVVPLDTQAGDPFRYHWFSMAHMATLAEVSGVPAATVVGRLWLVPFTWLVPGVLVSLGRQLSGRAGVGVLAAAFTVLSAQLRETPFYSLPGFDPLAYFSPSQIFGIPVLGLLLTVLIDVVRGRPVGRGGWAVLALAALAAPGSKSSILPTVVCALALTVVLTLVTRGAWRRILAALAIVAAAMGAGLPLSQGGDAGTGLQLWAVLGWTTPWTTEMGRPPYLAYHDSVLWHAGTPVGQRLVLILLLAYVLHAAWILPAAGLLRGLEPAAWLLTGLTFAGLAAMLLINHDGQSQIYFLRGVLPFAHVLGAWGAASLLGYRPDRRWLALGGATAVLLLVFTEVKIGRPVRGTVVPELQSALGFLALLGAAVGTWAAFGPGRARVIARQLGVGALVAGSLWFPLRDVTDAASAASTPLATAVALGLCLLVALVPAGRCVARAVAAGVLVLALGAAAWAASEQRRQDSLPVDPGTGATAEQTAAASWVAEHAAPFDLVATNVHCRPIVTRPTCDARSFWVAGLTERRVLIGGWGYTVQAHQAHGVSGMSSRTQPFHDPELFALNEAAFYAPTPEVLGQLRARGVRWLYADAAAGPVSPALDTLARRAYSSGTASIFDLTAG